jgi:hypothetical protein
LSLTIVMNGEKVLLSLTDTPEMRPSSILR